MGAWVALVHYFVLYSGIFGIFYVPKRVGRLTCEGGRLASTYGQSRVRTRMWQIIEGVRTRMWQIIEGEKRRITRQITEEGIKKENWSFN